MGSGFERNVLSILSSWTARFLNRHPLGSLDRYSQNPFFLSSSPKLHVDEALFLELARHCYDLSTIHRQADRIWGFCWGVSSRTPHIAEYTEDAEGVFVYFSDFSKKYRRWWIEVRVSGIGVPKSVGNWNSLLPMISASGIGVPSYILIFLLLNNKN